MMGNTDEIFNKGAVFRDINALILILFIVFAHI